MPTIAPRAHCLDECTFILFGATGDLSRRKLIPAIYRLALDKRICKFAVIGVAMDNTTAEALVDASRPFLGTVDEQVLTDLKAKFHYQAMDFNDASSYPTLAQRIRQLEEADTLPGNKLFYFATMPKHFQIITRNLLQHGIIAKYAQTPWARLVYEKPFGDDLASCQEMNQFFAQAFDESQLFRIDHYLGKELTGNIALTRFTNSIFEPLWNRHHIDQVQLTISETLGIDQRGRYYDHYGAIKDMVQSHLLQLLALTAMESPGPLTAENIRNAKAAALRAIRVEEVITGQYEGYLQEQYVTPGSTTETFAALRVAIDNDRWRGVPFFLTTGKALDRKEASIKLIFKMPECLLTHCPSQPNTLTIKIQPDDGIYLSLNAKIPGMQNEVAPVSMDFCHSCLFGPNTPEAYETLLGDVIRGDQSAFIRADEVELSWQIIEQLKTMSPRLESYKPGTRGPDSIRTFYRLTKDKSL